MAPKTQTDTSLRELNERKLTHGYCGKYVAATSAATPPPIDCGERDAISRNQSQSVAISRNQSQSVAISTVT